jgi:hypothetical protein
VILEVAARIFLGASDVTLCANHRAEDMIAELTIRLAM